MIAAVAVTVVVGAGCATQPPAGGIEYLVMDDVRIGNDPPGALAVVATHAEELRNGRPFAFKTTNSDGTEMRKCSGEYRVLDGNRRMLKVTITDTETTGTLKFSRTVAMDMRLSLEGTSVLGPYFGGNDKAKWNPDYVMLTISKSRDSKEIDARNFH